MEALSFFKFWRPNILITTGTETPPPSVYDYDIFDEDDDSLFELELDLSVLHDTKNSTKQSRSQSPINNAFFSRRKILPIESQPITRPQSPISIFKSSPKFPTLKFRKSKSLPTPETEKTGERECLNRARSNLSSSLGDDSVSKRLSKDVVQKYLKLVKPSNLKGSDRNISRATPSSPANSRKITGKGKSFSALAANGVSSPERKVDDSLYSDGIQSAILHCKKSFHFSKSNKGTTYEALVVKCN